MRPAELVICIGVKRAAKLIHEEYFTLPPSQHTCNDSVCQELFLVLEIKRPSLVFGVSVFWKTVPASQVSGGCPRTVSEIVMLWPRPE